MRLTTALTLFTLLGAAGASADNFGEPIYASPAISQGRFIIRTTKHLVCIGDPPR